MSMDLDGDFFVNERDLQPFGLAAWADARVTLISRMKRTIIFLGIDGVCC